GAAVCLGTGKFNLDVAVVVGHVQRFGSAFLVSRQIAGSLFDLAGHGKVVVAAGDSSANVPVFRGQSQGAAHIQLLQYNVASVCRYGYVSGYRQGGEGDVFVGGGHRQGG